jgi:hypothetical protein
MFTESAMSQIKRRVKAIAVAAKPNGASLHWATGIYLGAALSVYAIVSHLL